MKNPLRALLNWFRLEAHLVDTEQKEWYAFFYKG